MQPHHTVGFIKMMLVVKGEAVQTSELSMSFAGRQWDDSKTMSECTITNFNSIQVFRKLRGGGVIKKIGKKAAQDEAISVQKKEFLDFMMQKAVAKVTQTQSGIKALDDARQCMTDLRQGLKAL